MTTEAAAVRYTFVTLKNSSGQCFVTVDYLVFIILTGMFLIKFRSQDQVMEFYSVTNQGIF